MMCGSAAPSRRVYFFFPRRKKEMNCWGKREVRPPGTHARREEGSGPRRRCRRGAGGRVVRHTGGVRSDTEAADGVARALRQGCVCWWST
jgi:hypothetical protein